MRQLKRKWKLDLVHVNESTLLAYLFAARLAGLPVVLHARTALAKRPFESFLLRRIGRLHDTRIIAIDDEVRASFPERAQKIVRVVYNPIELGPTPVAKEIVDLRRSWGFSPEHVVIGQVASLHAAKGIWLILDLAENLCREFPHVRFVLIGDDSSEAGQGPELRQAISKRGLADLVVLPGYDDNLEAVYGSLDIALCLFGALGGVGRGAYEAAIAGKPLVATLPDPNTSETLINGVTARVFRPDDKVGIAQALHLLIANAEAREELGASAKATIGSRHAPDQIAQTIFDLYNDLVGMRSAEKKFSR